MNPARLLWRGLFLLLAVVLLAGGFLLARSASWRADALAGLEAGAELMEIDGRVIQVAVQGSGPPLLVLHGAPGGYDQALAVAAACGISHAKIIAPSRPGYLSTPLGSSLLPQQQARDLVALLDALGVERTAVLAFSAGAPVALALALNYPDRVSSLVILSGVASQLPHRGREEPSHLPEAISNGLTGDVGAALVAWALEHHPEHLLDASLPLLVEASQAERERLKTSILEDPVQWEIFRQLASSVVPLSPRESGTRNDLFQLHGLPRFPVQNMGMPVLVVHGVADPFVPAEGARALAASIPGAIFLPVDQSGHLVWLGPDAARANTAIREFLGMEGSEVVVPAPEEDETVGEEMPDTNP